VQVGCVDADEAIATVSNHINPDIRGGRVTRHGMDQGLPLGLGKQQSLIHPIDKIAVLCGRIPFVQTLSLVLETAHNLRR